MARRRKHIPIIEIAAAALAERLPPEDYDKARIERWPASKVLRLFTPDHIVLHAWGGANRWFNLSMTRRGPELKAKDAADTSRAAKAKRIETKWHEFIVATATGRKPPKKQSRWPKRRFGS
jgi:hypothetical protein